jgi:hypothetical protein
MRHNEVGNCEGLQMWSQELNLIKIFFQNIHRKFSNLNSLRTEGVEEEANRNRAQMGTSFASHSPISDHPSVYLREGASGIARIQLLWPGVSTEGLASESLGLKFGSPSNSAIDPELV